MSHPNIGQEIAALPRLTVQQLRERYAELFGEATRANNKPWLVKRLAWRLQALAEGGLSDAPADGLPNWPTMPTCGLVHREKRRPCQRSKV